MCHSKIDKCELPYWNSGFVSVEWGGAQLTFCSFSPLLVLTPGSLCATYVAQLGEIIAAVEFLIYYISLLEKPKIGFRPTQIAGLEPKIGI